MYKYLFSNTDYRFEYYKKTEDKYENTKRI